MSTIAAISTPRAAGGISVIRISGENAVTVAEKVFTPVSGKKAVCDMDGYTCAYGVIHDGGERLDDGVLTVFRAPRSYTGEDVAELSCHGGIFVTERVLRLVLSNGAAAAGAGEFTKRAFLNRKMNLTQAEAVMDMISAEGKAAHRSASALMEGALFRRISAVSGRLTAVLGALAAWVDYPEEDIPDMDERALITELEAAKTALSGILREYGEGRLVREGLDTVIAGKPNVGKSTLMNLLAGCDRSIVTDVAGTTRDIIEETVRIGDLCLRLSDTAGLRETDDIVENRGVERANKKIETADLILAVFDNSEPLSEEDITLARKCEGKKSVAIINKSDKPPALDRELIESGFSRVVVVSAERGEGVDELRAVLEEMFGANLPFDMGVLANERQRACAERALSAVTEAAAALKSGVTLDAVTVLIEEAEGALLELTGERLSEVVVNEVFSTFCVGK